MKYKIRKYASMNTWGKIIGEAETLTQAEDLAALFFAKTGQRCGVCKR